MKILIINGPNLNITGKRETTLYGHQDFNSYFQKIKENYKTLTLEYFHSNHAGRIIDFLQEKSKNFDGVIINAGAYTHTSLALGDAVASVKPPVIEVHITNTCSREQVRHNSYMAPHCKGIIQGFGLDVYRLAIEGLIEMNA